MTDFLRQAVIDSTRDAPVWLNGIRQQGAAQWRDSRLPTRKTEQWKYTSLNALRDDYLPAGPQAPSTANVAPADIPDIEVPGTLKLVFIDGVFCAEHSSATPPPGMTIVRFAEAQPAQQDLILQHLGQAAGKHRPLFLALNDATLADGLFVDIAPDTRIEQPLHMVWITSDRASAVSANQRLLLRAGKNASARIIEHFSASPGSTSFTNGITELLLEPGASVDHARLHLERGSATHIGSVHARLERDATLNSFHLALGSDLKRIDLTVNHAAPGAHCQLDGIYLANGTEHVDYHSCIEHAAEHCSTDERFRGIISDEATAVFNGRIHIHPGAQKTRAELHNRNLLTSTRATINTKPELEIYADDVQCAHGATVAQLDEQSVHYLRSRGIDEQRARQLLGYAFINELVDAAAITALRDYLQPFLLQAGRQGSGSAGRTG